MIGGGNWWRANEIVIRHLTWQTATRYPCRDSALKKSPQEMSQPTTPVDRRRVGIA
jgi:hypothetical protein